MIISLTVDFVYHELVVSGFTTERLSTFTDNLSGVSGEDLDATIIMDNTQIPGNAEMGFPTTSSKIYRHFRPCSAELNMLAVAYIFL